METFELDGKKLHMQYSDDDYIISKYNIMWTIPFTYQIHKYMTYEQNGTQIENQYTTPIDKKTFLILKNGIISNHGDDWIKFLGEPGSIPLIVVKAIWTKAKAVRSSIQSTNQTIIYQNILDETESWMSKLQSVARSELHNCVPTKSMTILISDLVPFPMINVIGKDMFIKIIKEAKRKIIRGK